MARTKTPTDDRPHQDYEIGNGATVRILFNANGTKPFMFQDDDSVVVSFDRDKFDDAKRAIVMGGDAHAPVTRSVTQISTRSRDLSPAEKAAALARIGEVSAEPSGPRPITSADVFAAAGVNPDILGAIERAAESS